MNEYRLPQNNMESHFGLGLLVALSTLIESFSSSSSSSFLIHVYYFFFVIVSKNIKFASLNFRETKETCGVLQEAGKAS